MRTVVWFSPVLLPEMLQALKMKPSVRAGWISSLLSALARSMAERRFVVVAVGSCRQEVSFESAGVLYYILPAVNWRMSAERKLLERAKNIIVEQDAVLVHVHGTETVFSKLALDPDLKVPVVVSLQGLLSKCTPFISAGLTGLETMRWQVNLWTALSGQGPLFVRRAWMRQARREQAVLARGRYFIGRTRWDRANVLAANPHAVYFVGNEILRDVFYKSPRRGEPTGLPTIVMGRATPLKGIATFLEMLRILESRGQPFEARVFGQFIEKNGLGRVIKSRIVKYGLESRIRFLGSLDETNVVKELSRATLYVHPSFIDNSPNSICEAMLLGVPVIATCCGGVSSLIEDGKTGVLVPPNDPESLAEAVVSLLGNDEKRGILARTARESALNRHHVPRICNEYEEIYASMIMEGIHGQ